MVDFVILAGSGDVDSVMVVGSGVVDWVVVEDAGVLDMMGQRMQIGSCMAQHQSVRPHRVAMNTMNTRFQ